MSQFDGVLISAVQKQTHSGVVNICTFYTNFISTFAPTWIQQSERKKKKETAIHLINWIEVTLHAVFPKVFFPVYPLLVWYKGCKK